VPNFLNAIFGRPIKSFLFRKGLMKIKISMKLKKNFDHEIDNVCNFERSEKSFSSTVLNL
ncbi:hypothetical protein MYX76_11775, partial [Desulfobacterota bacterium AH_259_B03_O07]|nr:hypothetical protein [Desulfobacterota bacterium AH_259_B03_O07]